MTEPTNLHDDDELLQQIGEMLDAVEPVPAEVEAFAQLMFSLRPPQVQLAEVRADSWSDGLVGVRDGGGARILEFGARTPAVSLELQLLTDGTMVGQLIPAEATTLAVHTVSGREELRTEATGSFITRTPRSMFVVVASTRSGQVAFWCDPRSPMTS